MFGITPSARLRPSAFYEATLADGVTAFTTYNHMLMPTSFGSPEEEYWRLLKGVSVRLPRRMCHDGCLLAQR